MANRIVGGVSFNLEGDGSSLQTTVSFDDIRQFMGGNVPPIVSAIVVTNFVGPNGLQTPTLTASLVSGGRAIKLVFSAPLQSGVFYTFGFQTFLDE